MKVITESGTHGLGVPVQRRNHLGVRTKRIKLERQEVVARGREA